MITYNPDNPQSADQIALDSNTLLAWFKANLKEKEEAEETLKMQSLLQDLCYIKNSEFPSAFRWLKDTHKWQKRKQPLAKCILFILQLKRDFMSVFC